MPAHHCPDCHGEGHFLAASSAYAFVDYYRCDRCGLVWTTPKGADGPILRHVTDRKPQPLQVSGRAGTLCRSTPVRRPLPLEAEGRRLLKRTFALGDQFVLLIKQRDQVDSLQTLRTLRKLRPHVRAHRDEIAAFSDRL